ncbi:MAG: hypothetical protein AAF497_14260 [Planctomycetota bacterium]
MPCSIKSWTVQIAALHDGFYASTTGGFTNMLDSTIIHVPAVNEQPEPIRSP